MKEMLWSYMTNFLKENRFTLAFVGIIVGVLLLWAAFFVAPDAPAGSEISSTTYHNTTLKIEIDYPSSWEPDTQFPFVSGMPTKFGGKDGFFAVDMIGGAASLASGELAASLINHELKPYGEHPRIASTTIDGQEGTFVVRDDAGGDPTKNDAVLVIRYPVPIAYGENTFEFLMVFGTKHYIESLSEHLRFID